MTDILHDITRRQRSILGFIRERVVSTGRPPTLREIGAHFGFRSTGTTRDHLNSLERKGYLTRERRQSRGIGLARPAMGRLPMLGRIPAGRPELAWEESDGFLDLDDLIPRNDRSMFALKVQGESLTGRGIFNGDTAIIRCQQSASPGDIVVALLGHEATLKILKKEKGGLILEAAHPNYPPIRKPFKILGRVVAVLKRF